MQQAIAVPSTSLSEIPASAWPDLASREHSFYAGQAGRFVLGLLGSMRDFPDHGYPVNVFRHSLQAASRCARAGEPDEMIVTALLHDIGEALTNVDHGKIAAAIVGPFVSKQCEWILEHHPVFQEYYYADKLGRDHRGREAFRGDEHFDATVRFCELFDQNSFDPSYDEMPLSTFEPLVERIFKRQPRH